MDPIEKIAEDLKQERDTTREELVAARQRLKVLQVQVEANDKQGVDISDATATQLVQAKDDVGQRSIALQRDEALWTKATELVRYVDVMKDGEDFTGIEYIFDMVQEMEVESRHNDKVLKDRRKLLEVLAKQETLIKHKVTERETTLNKMNTELSKQAYDLTMACKDHKVATIDRKVQEEHRLEGLEDELTALEKAYQVTLLFSTECEKCVGDAIDIVRQLGDMRTGIEKKHREVREAAQSLSTTKKLFEAIEEEEQCAHSHAQELCEEFCNIRDIMQMATAGESADIHDAAIQACAAAEKAAADQCARAEALKIEKGRLSYLFDEHDDNLEVARNRHDRMKHEYQVFCSELHVQGMARLCMLGADLYDDIMKLRAAKHPETGNEPEASRLTMHVASKYGNPPQDTAHWIKNLIVIEDINKIIFMWWDVKSKAKRRALLRSLKRTSKGATSRQDDDNEAKGVHALSYHLVGLIDAHDSANRTQTAIAHSQVELNKLRRSDTLTAVFAVSVVDPHKVTRNAQESLMEAEAEGFKAQGKVRIAEGVYNEKQNIFEARTADMESKVMEHELCMNEAEQMLRQVELQRMLVEQTESELVSREEAQAAPIDTKNTEQSVAEVRYQRAREVEEGRHAVDMAEERLAHLMEELRQTREKESQAEGRVKLARMDTVDAEKVMTEASAYLLARQEEQRVMDLTVSMKKRHLDTVMAAREADEARRVANFEGVDNVLVAAAKEALARVYELEIAELVSMRDLAQRQREIEQLGEAVHRRGILAGVDVDRAKREVDEKHEGLLALRKLVTELSQKAKEYMEDKELRKAIDNAIRMRRQVEHGKAAIQYHEIELESDRLHLSEAQFTYSRQVADVDKAVRRLNFARTTGITLRQEAHAWQQEQKQAESELQGVVRRNFDPAKQGKRHFKKLSKKEVLTVAMEDLAAIEAAATAAAAAADMFKKIGMQQKALEMKQVVLATKKMATQLQAELKSAQELELEKRREEAGTMSFAKFVSIMSKEGTPTKRFLDDQVDEFKSAFHLMDIDDSGIIHPEEFREGVQVLGIPWDARKCEEVFAEIDTDGNRDMDWAEFSHMMTSPQSEAQRQLRDMIKMRRCDFAVFDYQRQGEVTFTDIHLVVWCLGNNISKKEVEASVRAAGADQDGSGSIDFLEFCMVLSGPKTGLQTTLQTQLDRLHHAFQLVASDRKGFTAEILGKCVQKVNRTLPPAVLENVIKYLDKSHNGMIAFPEFVTSLQVSLLAN